MITHPLKDDYECVIWHRDDITGPICYMKANAEFDAGDFYISKIILKI